MLRNSALAGSLVVVLLVMGVVVVSPSPSAEPGPAREAPGLDPGHESTDFCRLSVTAGPGTFVDRGSLGVLETGFEFEGTFRYWAEPGGRMLYLYDGVQNLVARVVNPHSVRIETAAETP